MVVVRRNDLLRATCPNVCNSSSLHFQTKQSFEFCIGRGGMNEDQDIYAQYEIAYLHLRSAGLSADCFNIFVSLNVMTGHRWKFSAINAFNIHLAKPTFTGLQAIISRS